MDKFSDVGIRWIVAEPQERHVADIMAAYHVTRPTALVLARRNIPVEQIQDFLNPKLGQLTDPYLLPGLEKAAERLWRAITDNEKILIHGDYDTDGVTSTALLASVLMQHGAQVDCFVPNRATDGYGLTEASIRKAVDTHKVLVTVDCGITSHAAARMATGMGIDVIITDHHQPSDEALDAFAVINPKLHVDNPALASLQCLAGVGVSFKLCHAFLKYGREHNLGGHSADLREVMDLVAIGTVADIVPLIGENRCLVRHGLQTLTNQHRPGVRALCDVSGLTDQVQASDIAFRLAPRINAAGRLGDARDALDLLFSQDIVKAHQLARQLDDQNKERQSCEQRTVDLAHDQLEAMPLTERRSLVVGGENWHVGVIGIVASRLARRFHRPTVVLSIGPDGAISGSGRSIDGVNLVNVLHGCKALLERYGGHPMASGLAMSAENVDAFRAAFEAGVRSEAESESVFMPTMKLDGDLSLSELGQRFYEELRMLQPFGHSHAAPAFRVRSVRPERVQMAGQAHTRGVVTDDGVEVPFIAFNRMPHEFPSGRWEIAATPQLRQYNRKLYPQLQILDVRQAS